MGSQLLHPLRFFGWWTEEDKDVTLSGRPLRLAAYAGADLFEVHLQPRTLTSYPPTRSPSPRTFFVLQLVVDQASSNEQPPKVIHAFLVLFLVGTSRI